MCHVEVVQHNILMTIPKLLNESLRFVLLMKFKFQRKDFSQFSKKVPMDQVEQSVFEEKLKIEISKNKEWINYPTEIKISSS
jgi:hypothetical protein